jgi:predicted phosphoribosyltransferase
MAFEDRIDAGRRLAAALARYKGKSPAVLALPRGGVPVAAEIATMLAAPLDLILVRKIGVPGNRELAMGAIVDGAAPIVVRNEDIIQALGVTESEFNAVRDRELEEIDRRRVRCISADASGSISQAAPPSWSMTASRPALPCAPPCRRPAHAIRTGSSSPSRSLPRSCLRPCARRWMT